MTPPPTVTAPARIAYREEWLSRAVTLARDWFDAHGYTVPDNIRVTCGWPSKMALGKARRRIGECWSARCSGDEHFEISVSPVLDDGVKVLGVLVHEVVHATVGLECGHKGPFKQCATAVGLTGKMTSTTEGPELVAWCRDIIAGVLGPYPHATLDGAEGPTKKQTTRMLKMECLACGCIVRASAKWVDAYPSNWPCPCGGVLELSP